MEVGDRVKIRENIQKGYKTDPRCYINECMVRLGGKFTFIESVYTSIEGTKFYRVKIDHGAWSWTDKMLVQFTQRTE